MRVAIVINSCASVSDRRDLPAISAGYGTKIRNNSVIYKPPPHIFRFSDIMCGNEEYLSLVMRVLHREKRRRTKRLSQPEINESLRRSRLESTCF